MGDGQKEKLTADLQWAVQSHRTYCEAYLPEGPLREAAIKTAKVTMLFWTSLVAYIEDKYTLLMAFKLLPKHVLLLLSNQVVQICDDMFEFRNCTTNVDYRTTWPRLYATHGSLSNHLVRWMGTCAQSFVGIRPSTAHLSVSWPGT